MKKQISTEKAVIYTVLVMVGLALLGFPILKQTTTIETKNY